MIYSKNYSKKEIKLNFDASREDTTSIGWNNADYVKVLNTEDYPLDKNYKIIQ